ncbi:MAG: hypothetical protein RLZZ80_5, partial [Pseudomonadota bacterium]
MLNRQQLLALSITTLFAASAQAQTVTVKLGHVA